jgi:hypothetical protein
VFFVLRGRKYTKRRETFYEIGMRREFFLWRGV